MAKQDAKAPVQFEDFRPFYLKENFLWVPYMACGKWRLAFMDLPTAWKGVGYAMPVLGNAGRIVPFAKAALRRRGET